MIITTYHQGQKDVRGNLLKGISVAPRNLVDLFLQSSHMLYLDGCFCYDQTRILIALFRSFDGRIQPIAFSVCLAEDDACWISFLSSLSSAGLVCDDLVVMSDQNASIIKAVEMVFPNAEHSFCTLHIERHIQQKWQEKYGALKSSNKAQVERFNEIIAAYNRSRKALSEEEYKVNKEKVIELESGVEVRIVKKGKSKRKKDDETIADYIFSHKGIFAYKWRFPHYGCDTTNAVESAMAILRSTLSNETSIRDMRLFNKIRATISWMYEVLEDREFELHNHGVQIPINVEESPIYTSYAVGKVISLIHQYLCYQEHFRIEECDNDMNHYEVDDIGLDYKYNVDIHNKTCSCNDYYHTKIPCIHFVAVLYQRQELHCILDYVGKEYTLKSVEKCLRWLTEKEREFLKWMNNLTKEGIEDKYKVYTTVWWGNDNLKHKNRKRWLSRGEKVEDKKVCLKNDLD